MHKHREKAKHTELTKTKHTASTRNNHKKEKHLNVNPNSVI